MTDLTVNGQSRPIQASGDTPLLYVLRNDLALNGAKFGCGLGQCGACTVLVNDQPVLSCITPIETVADTEITTLEGMGSPDAPSALQQAFIDEQAAQCGYCIAGMIVRGEALLRANPAPDDADIRAALMPNLCRCGTHMRIVRAIHRAANTRREPNAAKDTAASA